MNEKWNQEKESKKRTILVEKLVEKIAIHNYIVYQQISETQLNRAYTRKFTSKFI